MVKMAWIQTNKKNRKDEDRRKERQKVYQDSRWKKLRVLALQLHPYCCVCGGVENLHVHHIVSMFDGYYDPQTYDKLAFGLENLCVLCSECHEKVHAGEINLNDYINGNEELH